MTTHNEVEAVAFERKTKYITFKIKDCLQLPPTYHSYLTMLISMIEDIRKERGKTTLEAVVVESDQPEYEAVWQLVQNRLEGVNNTTTIPTSEYEALKADAERFRFLTDDHADKNTRDFINRIGEHLSTKSYGNVCMNIDRAIDQAKESA